MLQTKSILKEKSDEDGLRISIMSRHTLNDWITPDLRITKESYDVWYKIFSPPLKLLWDYYKRWLSFEEYKLKYLEYLRTDEVSDEVKKLARESKTKLITILCIEDKPDKCHRKILAEECVRYENDLVVKIN